MNNQLWSWILTIVGVTGFILAGRKVWWCWYINLGCQVLWVMYAVATKQYGFIAAAFIYSFVFWQNAYKWTKEHRELKRIKAKFKESLKDQYVTILNDQVLHGEGAPIEEPKPMSPMAKAFKDISIRMRVAVTPEELLTYDERELKRDMRYRSRIDRERRKGISDVKSYAGKVRREMGLRIPL